MPFEISTLMNNSKDKVVLLRMKNSRTIQGRLKQFDIYMNLTLDDAEYISDENPEKLGTILIRGDNILVVSVPKEDS
ncbi:MAG: ribonucleoprotein [Thaumarchaeota archaeon]|nr:ribonucleoprotein [Nitrososphaerota archaeon]